jgi:hypothetical protein
VIDKEKKDQRDRHRMQEGVAARKRNRKIFTYGETHTHAHTLKEKRNNESDNVFLTFSTSSTFISSTFISSTFFCLTFICSTFICSTFICSTFICSTFICSTFIHSTYIRLTLPKTKWIIGGFLSDIP